MNITKLQEILACEIECGIFEKHVVPALEVARKVEQDERQTEPIQPEPVNQQMLAALKMVLDDPDALDGRPRTYKCVMEAIAAAEAAQPVACDEMSHEWTATRKGIFDKLAELGAIQTYSCCNVINKRCGTDKFEMKASQIEQLVFEVEKSTKLARIFQEGWRTYAPNVSSEHIKAIAKACKLIPSHTTKELVDRVVGFGHVLLGDKAVQEKFVEANAHLLCASQQPASAQPVAVQDGYVLRGATQKLVDALEKLARLGAGDRYGNSDGNVIAQQALAEYRAMLSAAPKPEGQQ